MKKKQDDLQEEVPIYAKILKEGDITLETCISSMQTNTIRFNEKKDQIMIFFKAIIKINLGIQEIRKELTYIIIKVHNDNETFDEVSEDTRVVENILQQVKSKANQ